MDRIGWQLPVGLMAVLACGGGPSPPSTSAKGEPSPDLIVSSPDSGDAYFDVIGALAIDRDSHLVVSLPRLRQFLIYSPEGALLTTLGRAGRGPGEFQAVASWGLLGDTLWVQDRISRRLTTFSISRKRLLATTTQTLALPHWPDPGTIRSILPDGTLLVEGGYSVSSLATGRTPSRVPVALLHRSGRIVQNYTPLDLSDWAFQSSTPTGGTLQGLQPFVPRPFLVVARDGTGFAFVQPTNAGIAITRIGSNADTVYSNLVPLIGDLLTKARFDSAIGDPSPLRSMPGGTIRRPSRLPPVESAVLGSDGSLWLRVDPGALHRPITRWVVLTPDGTVVDTVTTSAVQHLKAVSAEHYWVEEPDSSGLPILKRYRRSAR